MTFTVTILKESESKTRDKTETLILHIPPMVSETRTTTKIKMNSFLTGRWWLKDIVFTMNENCAWMIHKFYFSSVNVTRENVFASEMISRFLRRWEEREGGGGGVGGRVV